MRIIILVLLLILTPLAYAETVNSARGQIDIQKGDIVYHQSFWEGQISNLEDVTFVECNFARKQPHTQVFVNCKNLHFIDCNLTNVELQNDFIIQGSLTIHTREYEALGKEYREVECGDNKTRLYERIKIADNDSRLELRTVKDTPVSRRIKGIRVNADSPLFKDLRTLIKKKRKVAP